MYTAFNFTAEELSIARRFEGYFHNKDMDFAEKVYFAQLIASYELECGQACNEAERINIMTFMDTLDTIWHKLTRS